MDIFKKVRDNEDFYYYDEDGEETDEVVVDAEGNPFRADFILVDGTTIIYNASAIAKAKFSEKRARVKAKASGKTAEETIVAVQGADLEFKDYKKLNKEMSQEFILGLIATGKHNYITARETDEKTKREVTDSKGNIVTENVPTGRKMADGFKEMEYNVGTVLHLFTNDFEDITAKVMNKDRTGLYKPSEEIENPSLLAFQSVLDANKGKTKITVNPTFHESVDKMFQKEVEENAKGNEVELTVDEYKAQIKDMMANINPKNKPVVQARFKEKGILPKAYISMNSVEELKGFIDLLLV